jgi:F1F0 ATPase subunit 2
MTDHLLYYFIALLAGASVGFFYFGGLWWTVRRLSRSSRPALWSVGSFWIRSLVSLVVFYIIMGGRPEQLLLAILGFTAVRIFMVRALKPSSAPAKNRK